MRISVGIHGEAPVTAPTEQDPDPAVEAGPAATVPADNGAKAKEHPPSEPLKVTKVKP